MILSINAGLARPVRMVASSAAKWSTDFDIFVSASRRMGSIMGRSRRRPHKRSHLFTQHDPFDVAWGQEVEDDDGYVVVHAQRERGVVHDLDPAIQDFEVTEAFELGRSRIAFGVRGVHAIHLGRLRITSASISTARSAAVVSVVKYGLPVPAARMTTLPFSRCRTARRRI